MTQPGSIHRYRWKLWYYLLRLPVILANVFVLGFGVYAGVVLTSALVHSRSPAATALLLTPAFLIVMVLTIWRLPILMIHVGGLVASYVVVSPDALEIRIWPLYHVRLRWEDVERVGRSPGWGGAYEALSLEGAEELPDGPIATRLRKLLRWVSRNETRSLSLRNVQGYPRGDFAGDLRRYAPQLFTAE